MKTKYILTILCCLTVAFNAEAQILKKLRKKAEQAAERTILKKTDEVVTKKTEKTIDDATSKKDKPKNNEENRTIDTNEGPNTALKRHTKSKKDFFKEDMVIKLHENGKLNQTQYFDVDEIAVRIDDVNKPDPGFIDSEGFIYGYNEKEGEYNKSSLVALQSQGMMVPTMLLEAYKLPPEPFMAHLQKQQDEGMTPNPFNGIVEFAFIYEPEDFRYEDFKETKQNLRGKSYTKFDFLNEPGYEGSYVIFDEQDRLVEIYTNKTSTSPSSGNFEMDMIPPGESLLLYDYKPVDVELPLAREVKAQGQEMMEMLMGSFKIEKDTDDHIERDYETTDSKGMVKTVRTSIKNNKITKDMLPKSYDFDYTYKATFTQNSKKSDALDMNFLINTKKGNYNGAEYILNKKQSEGSTTMIFDLDLRAMVMLMEYGNQKFLQIHPIPEVKETKTEMDFTIKELPPKTILGYKCTGLQLENDTYTMKVYHAKNAPVSLNNFFGFSGTKSAKELNLPNMDPRLLKQFENSLVMEMQYEDKKRKKNNFTITAISLEKTPKTISTTDYQSMNMLSGSQIFKN